MKESTLTRSRIFNLNNSIKYSQSDIKDLLCKAKKYPKNLLVYYGFQALRLGMFKIVEELELEETLVYSDAWKSFFRNEINQVERIQLKECLDSSIYSSIIALRYVSKSNRFFERFVKMYESIF